MITFMLPCVGLVAMGKRVHDNDNCCEPPTVLISMGFCCVFGIVGVFNLCLIALCYKGADDWDMMSYAGLAGTIMGAMVCFVLCPVCITVTSDKY